MPAPVPSLSTLAPADATFHTVDELHRDVEAACTAHPERAEARMIGRSEEGRPLLGVVLGTGGHVVSLIAGNHADEPVGPETLRAFVCGVLERAESFAPLLERYRFVMVPHTNPDGAVRNRPWIEQWPGSGVASDEDAAAVLEAYLAHRARELPGRDLEFGFPNLRTENQAVADFMSDHAPLAMHASLHGMGVSEGAMLLIERYWTFRTQGLRDAFRAAAKREGLRMHDHNRKGEKGFFWIEPGFTTTPEGAAMRAYFRAQGQPEMAERFYDSSMEHARSLSHDPLCLVTELPLFVVDARVDDPPGTPSAYLEAREAIGRGDEASALRDRFGLRLLPLERAMRLQLRAVELGLDAL